MRLVYGVLARPHYKTEYLEVPLFSALPGKYGSMGSGLKAIFQIYTSISLEQE